MATLKPEILATSMYHVLSICLVYVCVCVCVCVVAVQHWAFSDFRTGRVISKANDPTSNASKCIYCVKYIPSYQTVGIQYHN